MATFLANERYGNGSDGALVISADTTETVVDSACTGTSGTTSLSATNASFAANKIILIHQSRGTGVGNKEVNVISSYVAGTITTKYPLANSYGSGAQVRVLPQYTNVTINTTKFYYAKTWDGTVGGILAFVANGLVTVTGSLSGAAKGYRGGTAVGDNFSQAGSGEGNPGASLNQQSANGNGGGGGAVGYGGGGGGSVAGSGGNGGSGPGLGGSTVAAHIFGGGGGGASGNGGSSNGGQGGGYIFIICPKITGAGTIDDNGADTANTVARTGGAGGGGSIYIQGKTIDLASMTVRASGGTGGTGGQDGGGAKGGNGGAGNVVIDYSDSVAGTTTPAATTTKSSSLADTPAGYIL